LVRFNNDFFHDKSAQRFHHPKDLLLQLDEIDLSSI
jgi:hypothetical protein